MKKVFTLIFLCVILISCSQSTQVQLKSTELAEIPEIAISKSSSTDSNTKQDETKLFCPEEINIQFKIEKDILDQDILRISSLNFEESSNQLKFPTHIPCREAFKNGEDVNYLYCDYSGLGVDVRIVENGQIINVVEMHFAFDSQKRFVKFECEEPEQNTAQMTPEKLRDLVVSGNFKDE